MNAEWCVQLMLAKLISLPPHVIFYWGKHKRRVTICHLLANFEEYFKGWLDGHLSTHFNDTMVVKVVVIISTYLLILVNPYLSKPMKWLFWVYSTPCWLENFYEENLRLKWGLSVGSWKSGDEIFQEEKWTRVTFWILWLHQLKERMHKKMPCFYPP